MARWSAFEPDAVSQSSGETTNNQMRQHNNLLRVLYEYQVRPGRRGAFIAAASIVLQVTALLRSYGIYCCARMKDEKYCFLAAGFSTFPA